MGLVITSSSSSRMNLIKGESLLRVSWEQKRPMDENPLKTVEIESAEGGHESRNGPSDNWTPPPEEEAFFSPLTSCSFEAFSEKKKMNDSILKCTPVDSWYLLD